VKTQTRVTNRKPSVIRRAVYLLGTLTVIIVGIVVVRWILGTPSTSKQDMLEQANQRVVAQSTPPAATLDLGDVTFASANPCQNPEVVVRNQPVTVRADGYAPNNLVTIQAATRSTEFGKQAAVSNSSGVVTQQVIVPNVQAGTFLAHTVTGLGQLGIERTSIAV
jgi:hypothetical protein